LFLYQIMGAPEPALSLSKGSARFCLGSARVGILVFVRGVIERLTWDSTKLSRNKFIRSETQVVFTVFRVTHFYGSGFFARNSATISAAAAQGRSLAEIRKAIARESRQLRRGATGARWFSAR